MASKQSTKLQVEYIEEFSGKKLAESVNAFVGTKIIISVQYSTLQARQAHESHLYTALITYLKIIPAKPSIPIIGKA